jgi:hypothetical protein
MATNQTNETRGAGLAPREPLRRRFFTLHSSPFTLRRPTTLVIALVALLTSGAGFRETLTPRAFVLAGEPLSFDAGLQPRFSESQLRSCAPSTREGLTRWAATANGRRMLEHFNSNEYSVRVMEDPAESGAGRAPQPGLATLIAAADHSRLKRYDLILNPGYGAATRFDAVPGKPSTPGDMMAVAWAAEMLHIYYYSKGISLPHHERADFQQDWREIAGELGFPSVKHDGSEAPDVSRRARVTYW